MELVKYLVSFEHEMTRADFCISYQTFIGLLDEAAHFSAPVSEPFLTNSPLVINTIYRYIPSESLIWNKYQRRYVEKVHKLGRRNWKTSLNCMRGRNKTPILTIKDATIFHYRGRFDVDICNDVPGRGRFAPRGI
jgi:hypothetical protein